MSDQPSSTPKFRWVVALFGEIAESDDKIGALHREILGEAWTVQS